MILGAAAAACAALFFDGGLEALLGAGLGAVFSTRSAPQFSSRAMVPGALGGLFAGAMFAGFFHNAIAALATALL